MRLLAGISAELGQKGCAIKKSARGCKIRAFADGPHYHKQCYKLPAKHGQLGPQWVENGNMGWCLHGCDQG